jgi:2-dehydro-3-deoxyphosphogluconate aldolase/(4S)-4-hydroxy-2-oxoglutarate aldolase
MLRSSVRNLAAAARSGIPTVARARNMVIAPRVASASSFGKGRDEYESVLDRFRYHRACAVLRTPTSEACPKAMTAAIDGGFKIVEFTLTTPDCLQHMADFRAKYDGEVMIGCGTIMDVEDAISAIEAGAEFIVTPVTVPEVVKFCAHRNVVVIPGCQTPTELYQAYLLGAPVQKLFPGVAGGAGYVKAVSAALPMLNINPTSGVDLDNAGEFLRSGATSVGLVAPLFPPELISSGNWDAIAENARKVMGKVAEVGPLPKKA